MSRFTKSAAVEQIRARADSHQKARSFDLNNGTSQLWPREADSKMKALIDRAVAYGYMEALAAVANEMESGQLGVSVK